MSASPERLGRRMDRGLGNVEEWVMAFLLAAAGCLGMFQIVLRYVFAVGYDWVEAYLIMFVIYSALIGASVAVRRGLHVRLDVVVDQLPPRPRWAAYLAINALSMFYTVCLWIFGVQFMMLVIRYGNINIESDLPVWVHQLSVPVGMTLMSFRYAQEIWRLLRGGPAALPDRVQEPAP